MKQVKIMIKVLEPGLSPLRGHSNSGYYTFLLQYIVIENVHGKKCV